MSIARLSPFHFTPDMPNLRDHTADHRMVLISVATMAVWQRANTNKNIGNNKGQVFLDEITGS